MISAERAALSPGRLALFYGLHWARRRGDKWVCFCQGRSAPACPYEMGGSVNNLHPLTWSQDQLGEALLALAQAAKLSPHPIATPVPPSGLADEDVGKWVETAVATLGLEAEPTRIAYGELAEFLRTAGPALFQIATADGPRYLALLNVRRGTAVLLDPQRQTQKVPLEAVRTALAAAVEAPLLPQIEALLAETAVSSQQQAKVRQFILREQLANTPVGGCWLLDLSPGGPFWPQLRRAGFLRHALTFTGTYFVQHFLFLFSWWLIGRAVFQERVEMGWLMAWALVLLSLLPLRMLNNWLQGLIAVNLGGLLQKRLLFGAMRLHPDEIRHEGAGQLMGRVFESEAIETVSLNGGIRGLTAIIELIMAFGVLSVGAGGVWHGVLLLFWVGIISGILVVFYKRRHRWTVRRRDLTHYLVEVMVGHRTRLAQSLRRHWHRGEDDDLADYVKVLDSVDRTGIILEVFISHGWLVVGLLGLVPAFVSGSSPAALAISLGGVLSAEAAFRKFALGLVNQLLAGFIAWDQIKPLFAAAARPEMVGDVSTAVATNSALTGVAATGVAATGMASTSPASQLLGVHDVSFRYNAQGDQVLDRCSLRVQSGDRILLEGPSGGGKSTLAAVLTGLRQPDSGLVLWQGLDRMTLGSAGWRRRVVFAPQFHENHVLGSTFLFNLLMGRRWPPRREDVALAQALCEELGLSEVLARMPAGMLQTVGETGWQLSHGEKSRLYIARAILQGVDLIILDESFAALDPQSLQRAMACVRERAKTLLVIAHP